METTAPALHMTPPPFTEDGLTIEMPSNESGCLRGGPSLSQDRATQISIQCILALLMFGLGNTTEIKVMWKYLKKPHQYVTALAIQLIFFPFFGLALSQMFRFTPAEAMGAIISSSCPGGTYSNIASYWLDGDMNLSIVLTTLSTILALGTMPLWLYVLPLTINMNDHCLTIPFQELGYALLVIFCPVMLGLLVKYKAPKVAKILVKVCTVLGSLGVVAFLVVFMTTINTGILDRVPWTVVFASFLMLILSGLFGYLCTRLPCLTFSVQARRTIALETMMQNNGLALTIVVISYSLHNRELPQILSFIFIYGFFQLGGTVVAVLIYLFLKWKGWCRILQVEESKTSDGKTKSELSGIDNKSLEGDDKHRVSAIA